MRKGFNNLPRVARKIPGSAADIVEKVVMDIAAGAAVEAPIDTGALAGSYKGESQGLDGTAGSNMEYAPYVEYGTTRGSPEQPHLRPSADRVEAAIDKYARDFGDDIEKAARGG